MTYAPTLLPESVEFPPEVYITPFSRSGTWAHLAAGAATAPTSSTWDQSNRAFYYPIFIPRTVVATRLFALNGSVAGGTNNRDIGIYRSSGGVPTTLIVSDGGTAISGANVVQYEDIADTTLVGPALYFLAIVHNGITDTGFRAQMGGIAGLPAMLMMSQATAYPLPSTATPVASTYNVFSVCGITLRSSP